MQKEIVLRNSSTEMGISALCIEYKLSNTLDCSNSEIIPSIFKERHETPEEGYRLSKPLLKIANFV